MGTILTWNCITEGDGKLGWCHATKLAESLDAVSYQTGQSLNELKLNCSKVEFYLRKEKIGTYYFESGEFYPTEFYDNSPDILGSWL